MKRSSCKAKGKRCAQETVELLYKHWPDGKPGDIRTTTGSAPGEDILLSPSAVEAYPFAIECKNQEKLNIWDALSQSESYVKEEELAEGKKVPLLFFKRNRSKLFVALSAEMFLKLIKE